MILSRSIEVPPNTPENEPTRLLISPGARQITSIAVLFPDGCLNAVGIRFVDAGSQFAPIGSGWIIDNNNLVLWPENHELTGPETSLSIETYSQAEDWPHTLQVRITFQ